MENIESPSLDFIAGLISTGATFMWVKQKQTEIPVFQIKMHASQKSLLETLRTKLGLTETIHHYQYKNRDYLLLLVRKRSVLENVIIPIFDGRLIGKKKIQFENWKNKYFQKQLTFIYKHYK